MVDSVPMKNIETGGIVKFMSEKAVSALLATPDAKDGKGRRDRALLAFMYDSDARVQEAVSVTPAIHYAALMRLRDIIRESFIGEIHPDFKKGRDSVRRPENGANPFVQIVVLYGCVSMAGILLLRSFPFLSSADLCPLTPKS